MMAGAAKSRVSDVSMAVTTLAWSAKSRAAAPNHGARLIVARSFRWCVVWRFPTRYAGEHGGGRAGPTNEGLLPALDGQDKVWVMGLNGSNPHFVEPLHDQVTIDGSRALGRPRSLMKDLVRMQSSV